MVSSRWFQKTVQGSPPWEQISLMDRYIIRQLIPPFCFSVGIVASLGLAIGYLSDLSNKIVEDQLPLINAVEILLLKIPEFLTYSLPISVMLATLLTFGRLSGDSELIAIRACGVSLLRIVLPAIGLSILVTIWTFLLSEWAVPAANFRATSILVNVINEEHPFWQNRDIFYPEFETVTRENGKISKRLKSLVYAEEFNGKAMENLTVLKWSDNRLQQILLSDHATWNSERNQWDFFQGTLYRLNKNAAYQDATAFEKRSVQLPKAAFDFARQGRDPYEMTITEAKNYMEILKLIGDEKKLTFFAVRTEQKLAFPFVCIVFCLVGSAIGCRPQRISRATGFGVCVAVIFAYYVLGFVTGSLGIAGALTPALAAWIPNGVGLGLGFWLLYQFNRG